MAKKNYGTETNAKRQKVFLAGGSMMLLFVFFFQAEDGIRDVAVTGVQTCALPILSAQACQPFCCQRTFFPSRSECPECLRTCLEGLTSSFLTNLPSSSAPVSSGILLRVLVALRLASEIPCGTSSHSPPPLVTTAK